VSWSTLSFSQVWVSLDGGQEILFAQGSSGPASASWIQNGHIYLFPALRRDWPYDRSRRGYGHALCKHQRQPYSLPPTRCWRIRARRTIAWDTGDGSLGQVWVSIGGGTEVLFAQGASESRSGAVDPGRSRLPVQAVRRFDPLDYFEQRGRHQTDCRCEPVRYHPIPYPRAPASDQRTISWTAGTGVGEVWVSLMAARSSIHQLDGWGRRGSVDQ